MTETTAVGFRFSVPTLLTPNRSTWPAPLLLARQNETSTKNNYCRTVTGKRKMVYTVTLMNPVASMGNNGDLLMEFVVKKQPRANGASQERSEHDDTTTAAAAAAAGVNSEGVDGGGGGSDSGEGGVAALTETGDPHQQPPNTVAGSSGSGVDSEQ